MEEELAMLNILEVTLLFHLVISQSPVQVRGKLVRQMWFQKL
jgi:hypothetical protein